jgi:hypothetical protein
MLAAKTSPAARNMSTATFTATSTSEGISPTISLSTADL